MKKSILLLFLFIPVFLFHSCKKSDITPAYLLLSEEDFDNCINVSNFNEVHKTKYDKDELDVIKQQSFKDVLVSINGKNLGYWKLPCKIPLLPNYSGLNNIQVIPCVRVPYTSLLAVPYYFLEPVPKEHFLEIEKEKEYRLDNLKYEYVPSVEFTILETFTNTTSFKPLDTVRFITPMEVFYHPELKKNVGRIALEEVDSLNYCNVVTSFFNLKAVGMRHFWEMKYKCESGEVVTYLNFRNTSTGIYQQDMVILPATTTWKKVYIDLTDVIAWTSGANDFVSVRLGIRGNPNPDSPKATFYFDNIKLVTMFAPY